MCIRDRRHAQCADGPQRQQVARDDAQRCTRSPRRRGQRDGTVGVEGVQITRPGDGDAEQLVSDVIADDEPVEKRRTGGEPLGQRTAHQQIAGIGDEGDDGYLEIGRAAGNEGKGGVLARRSIVEQAGHEALQGCKARCPGRDAQRERHGEIPQRDRHAVPHPLAEHLAAESIGFGGLCGAESLFRRLMRSFHEKSSFPISNTSPIIA